jgi:multiple sugar transport system permease protein
MSAPTVSAPTPSAIDALRASTPRAKRHRRQIMREGRRSTLLTVLLWACAAYFLLPLLWLLIASTKSNADLFSSFGFWFGKDFNLFTNIAQVFTFKDGVYLRWVLNTVV